MNENDLFLDAITRISMTVSSWSGKRDIFELMNIVREVKGICRETLEKVERLIEERSGELLRKIPAHKV